MIFVLRYIFHVAQGIVAAVRELGGKFLELEEQSGTYYDIGDKKAWAKTSQALREGQTKIRQKMYSETTSNFDTSLLASSTHHQPRAITPEGYFGYSVQLLESLYKAEEDNTSQPSPSRQISQSPSLDSDSSNQNLYPI